MYIPPREIAIKAKFPGQPWETVDTADTPEEARYLLQEYKLAFGSDARLKLVLRDCHE